MLLVFLCDCCFALSCTKVPSIKKHKFVSSSPSLIAKATRSRSSQKADEFDGGGSADNAQRKWSRMYLHEGPVTFVSVCQHGNNMQKHIMPNVLTYLSLFLQPNSESRRRYLFLFKDLLIVGKPGKARHNRNFRLKHWVPMADVWISENIRDVVMAEICPAKAFVIGWPTVNFVATFG